MFFVTVRNYQTVFKFTDYIETNSKANWTISTDIEGNNTIPTRTVQLSLGNPDSNLFYIYVSNEETRNYETYPILIHRNYIFTAIYFSQVVNIYRKNNDLDSLLRPHR